MTFLQRQKRGKWRQLWLIAAGVYQVWVRAQVQSVESGVGGTATARGSQSASDRQDACVQVVFVHSSVRSFVH